jgi:hypothetical protein
MNLLADATQSRASALLQIRGAARFIMKFLTAGTIGSSLLSLCTRRNKAWPL